MKTMKTHLFAKLICASALVLGAGATNGCSAAKTTLPDRPLDIVVKITASKPNARDARLPLTFDVTKAESFTLDLEVRNVDGSTRTKFTGPHAWVRLNVEPGQIVGSSGPEGEVAGPNVHFTNGKATGITIGVIGAYGDARIVAQDVGFTPAVPGKQSACSDGADNDKNGYADYPNDPSCIFFNDDSEAPFEAGRGISQPIFFEHPTIHDVQGGSVSPFLARQVDMPGEKHRMIVTAVVNNGMYVTDVDDEVTCSEPGKTVLECADDKLVGRGSNSIFVFNFQAPFGVRACDRLMRLAGNVAEFFGSTQLGTPGWTNQQWQSALVSGPCPIPDFHEVSDKISGRVDKMEPLESSLVLVKNPVIGTHFGKEKVPINSFGDPEPADGASNCDLNGDGIVGFNSGRGGYSEIEKKCNDVCAADLDCTEWNNFKSFSQVKIKFGAGALFFSPGAIAGFDSTEFVGDGKFVELRGVLTNFVGPTPPYSIEPRCEDDVIVYSGQCASAACPAGTTCDEKTKRCVNDDCKRDLDCPATFHCEAVTTPPQPKRKCVLRDAKTACVKSRVGIDSEGTN